MHQCGFCLLGIYSNIIGVGIIVAIWYFQLAPSDWETVHALHSEPLLSVGKQPSWPHSSQESHTFWLMNGRPNEEKHKMRCFEGAEAHGHMCAHCEALQQLNAADWVLDANVCQNRTNPRCGHKGCTRRETGREKARRGGSLRLVIMSVLDVKNKGEPCSHRAGMSPRRGCLNTRKGWWC